MLRSRITSLSDVRVRRSVIGSGNIFGDVDGPGADFAMVRVCAEITPRPLLATPFMVGIYIGIYSTHGFRILESCALLTLHKILSGDDRRQALIS